MSTTSGYKNVAYFVNWVYQSTAIPTSYHANRIRESTAATTTPKTYQQKS